MVEPLRSRAVCVIGFHRSGTSLAARILNVLGVHLGEESDLLAPTENDNPRGYWEPRWMIDLNDELLARFGGTWWQSFPGAPGWERDPALAPLLERARSTMAEKLGDAPLVGWKDPRVTLTLPFWRQVAPDPLYVVCMRNPADAVASLQRRPEPDLSVRAWGELWLEYTARALSETSGSPRTLLFYEDLLHDGRAAVERLARFVGLPLGDDDPRLEQALAEISVELQHHTTSALELAALPGIPTTARTLFLGLRATQDLRAADESSTLAQAIERIVPELWWTDRTSTALAERADALERQLADARAELERTRTELESAQSRERAAAAQLDQAAAEAAQLRADLQEIRGSRAWRVVGSLRRARARALRAG